MASKPLKKVKWLLSDLHVIFFSWVKTVQNILVSPHMFCSSLTSPLFHYYLLIFIISIIINFTIILIHPGFIIDFFVDFHWLFLNEINIRFKSILIKLI